MSESTKQLDVTHGTLNKLKRDISVEAKKYMQLMAICQTNIKCLGVVRSHIGEKTDCCSCCYCQSHGYLPYHHQVVVAYAAVNVVVVVVAVAAMILLLLLKLLQLLFVVVF